MERRDGVERGEFASSSPKEDVDVDGVDALSLFADVRLEGQLVVHQLDEMIHGQDRRRADLTFVPRRRRESLRVVRDDLAATTSRARYPRDTELEGHGSRRTSSDDPATTHTTHTWTTTDERTNERTNQILEVSVVMSVEVSPDVVDQDLRPFVKAH